MTYFQTNIWKALPVAAMLAASGFVMLIAPAEHASAQQKGAPPQGKGGGGQAKAQAKGKNTLEEIHTLKVQGNVYMITGPLGNSVVQVGDSGVMVVDTQTQEASAQLIAEIRKLSDKPIRYVVDSSIDKVAGNAPISRAGAPVTGGNLGAVALDNGATIVAHEQVLFRMSNGKEGVKEENADALPTTTFDVGQKEIFFNEEPVLVIFQPKAHTDGDSMIFFRRSDVVAAGNIFDMTSFPRIELDKGGSIAGELKALNMILDICIPKHQQEGGTYVIPGRGRLTDEHDVLEYRDMVTIIRDRVKASIAKKMTLAQVIASKPTYEYDARWGRAQGGITGDQFTEMVFKSLSDQK